MSFLTIKKKRALIMKIGITEAGDASLDYSWVNKLQEIDGAILITKNVTDKFIETVLKYKKQTHHPCDMYRYGWNNT